jgi:hypothetical protein
MVLWEVTSYRTGLRLESQRLMARAELKDKHGRGWRRKTTMVQRVRLRMGETAPAGVPELMAAPGPVQEALELEQVAGADIVPDPEPELELEPEPYLEEPVGIPMELERELELLNRNWNFEPEPERVEPEPEPELPSELEPEPEPEQPEPEPRTGTANITDRATKKKAQVRQVMELLEQFGIDGVDLKVIKTHHPEIPRTTAHHRLKEAKAEWNRNKARVPNASDLFDLELEPSTGTGT